MKRTLQNAFIAFICCSSFIISIDAKAQIKDAVMLMGEDERRIAQGCEAICYSSFETEDIESIVALADEYDISSLYEIARLRKSRQLDAGNILESASLGTLLERVERKHNGKVSYEEVYVRLVQGMLCHAETTKMEIYGLAKEKAQELQNSNRESFLYNELFLISNLLYIATSTDIHGPTKYTEFKRTILDLLNLYEQSNIHSFLRQEFGGHLIGYISYMTPSWHGWYESYCKHIDQKLKKEYGNLYHDISIENILLAGKEEAVIRKPANHPEICMLESRLWTTEFQNSITSISRKDDRTSALNALQNACVRIKDYFGADSPMTKCSELSFSLKSMLHGNIRPEYTDDMRDKLATIKSEWSQDYELLLGLYIEMFNVFVSEKPNIAAEIYKEMVNVAEKIRSTDENSYFIVLCNKIILQRCSVTEYGMAAEEMKHLLNEYYQQNKDWRFVKMADNLLTDLIALCGNTKETLEIGRLSYHTALELLSGSHEDLAVFLGINYANITCNSFSSIYDDSFDIFLENLEKDAEKHGISTSMIILDRAIQYFNTGEQSRAMSLLREASDKTPNDDIITPALYSAWILYSSNSDSADNALTHRCVKYLDSLFEMEYDAPRIEHMEAFRVLARYYGEGVDLSRSHRILQRCFDYYNSDILVPDNNYTMIAIDILQLYASGYGNLEQCRLLLNDIRQRTDKVKAYVGFESYLMLLRASYDFVVIKSPYDSGLQALYLYPLMDAYKEYFAINNYSMDVAWMHLPQFLTILSNLFHAEKIRAEYLPPAIRESRRKATIKQYEPTLNFAKSLLDNATTSIKSSENYCTLLMALGQTYELLLEDYPQADFYYQEMMKHNSPYSKLGYLNFLIRRENWTKALTIAKSVSKEVDKSIDRTQKRGYNSNYSDVIANLFIVYLKNGLYDIALHYASLYMQIRKYCIDTNFDYFTPQERESFIMQGGAGGAPTFALLAFMDGDINGTAYDAVLQEKGLLLRSSDRVHNAIMNSGNQRLIACVDSIQILTQSLLSVPNDTDMSEGTMRHFAKMRGRLDELERYVSVETATYRDGSENVPSWENVRDALKDDEAAIEFVPGDSSIYALVLKSGSKCPKKVTVLNKEDLFNLSGYFSDQSILTEKMKFLYDNEAKKLYHTIWEPLMPHIGNAKRIFYSPAGILNALSFNAFQLDDNSYLIDHFELRQLSSTANLVRRNIKDSRPQNINSALVIGGLCYDKRQLPFVSKEVDWAKQNSNPVVLQRESLESFSFLPFSFIEKDNITSTLKDMRISTTERSLMDAGETNIRELLRRTKPGILHISTHGFSYSNIREALEIPYLTNNGQLTSLNTAGIALSNANLAWEGMKLPKEADNILSADEIAVLDLRETKLAVLSACNTALGAVSYEGVMGLQRGLKEAGVETLCLTLWSVNDASSSSLMSTFYIDWLTSTNNSISGAMRTAMKKQREITPSPYFWAPFILIDDIQ